MSAAGKGFAGLESFSPVDFGHAVEDGFGISAKSVFPLRGRSHSLNFKVVGPDGVARLFKCVRPGSGDAVRRLFAHSRSAQSQLVPSLLFDGRTVDIGGCRVFAMSWVDGEPRPPDSLSPDCARRLAERHAEILGSLRDDGEVLPVRDLAAVRRDILEKPGVCSRGELLRELERMDESSLVRDPARTRVIHGDLNPGNVLWENGDVSGFLDLEELRFGYPAEDLVRYVISGAEHVKWFEFWRTAGARRTFAEIVRHSRFPADEWLLAINGYLLWKLRRKASSAPGALGLRMKWRLRLYRDMREIAAEAAS